MKISKVFWIALSTLLIGACGVSERNDVTRSSSGNSGVGFFVTSEYSAVSAGSSVEIFANYSGEIWLNYHIRAGSSTGLIETSNLDQPMTIVEGSGKKYIISDAELDVGDVIEYWFVIPGIGPFPSGDSGNKFFTHDGSSGGGGSTPTDDGGGSTPTDGSSSGTSDYTVTSSGSTAEIFANTTNTVWVFYHVRDGSQTGTILSSTLDQPMSPGNGGMVFTATGLADGNVIEYWFMEPGVGEFPAGDTTHKYHTHSSAGGSSDGSPTDGSPTDGAGSGTSDYSITELSSSSAKLFANTTNTVWVFYHVRDGSESGTILSSTLDQPMSSGDGGMVFTATGLASGNVIEYWFMEPGVGEFPAGDTSHKYYTFTGSGSGGSTDGGSTDGGSTDGGSSGGGQSGSSDPLAFTALPQEQRDYLKYVEDYLDRQTILIDNSALGKPNDHVVRTYNVGPGNPFEVAADTYDNSLAAQFFTAIGKPQKAARILDTWLRMSESATSDPDTKGLFWPRVQITNVEWAVSWLDGDSHKALDVGNNSMMGLAFCKYYLQFQSAGADIRYYNAAKTIMSTIHNNYQCNDTTKGYKGRKARAGDPGGGNQSWRSVEHNLDMYALGACVEEAASLAGDGTATAVAVKQRAGAFVDAMWDAPYNRYRVGTGLCEDGPNAFNNNYIAVDSITWRYLSKAAGSVSSHEQKSQASMATLISDFLFEDTDWTAILGVPYWGVPFSKYGTQPWAENGVQAPEGYGAQQENVGAMLLALNAYHNEMGSSYGGKIDDVRAGVKKMLDFHKAHGIPAHYEETVNCEPLPHRANCNTGLNWSYARDPHTAATAYFGLALLYQWSNGGEINAGANPYSNFPSRIITQETLLPVDNNYDEAPKPSIIHPYTGDEY